MMLMKEQADILLVYPPHNRIDFGSSIPHLSAYLKKRGFKVLALDAPSMKMNVWDIVVFVSIMKPRSVGVSIPFTPMAGEGLKLVKELKRFFPDLPLIVGGVHPTLCPEEFVDDAFVCSGDGERALLQFIHWVKGNWPMPDRILKIPTPIHEIEPPDWSCVCAHKYRAWTPNGRRAFPVQGCIGCPYNCIFCSSSLLFGGKVHFKSIDQVKAEIEAGIKQFGIRVVIFRDENITLNRERFRELCAYLKANDISWWAQTRANLIDKELADLAKNSGCIGISIGVETGDAGVMEKIQKGITLEAVEEAFKILQEAGLLSAANFMVGHPWDTLETVKRTMDFADKIDPDYYGIQIATPFPGTEFRKVALEMGTELTEDWGNYLTSNDNNFQPPGLKGHDLKALRNRMEWEWHIRKPLRRFRELFDYRSMRLKLRYLRRMFNLFRSEKGEAFID